MPQPYRTVLPFTVVVFLLVLLGLGMSPSTTARAQAYTVTKTADTADGVCDADCSLREAIIAANASAEADTIFLGPGIFYLTIGDYSEDEGISGDLDITGDTVISGAGPEATIIDASGLPNDYPDRIFDIRPKQADGAPPSVHILGITIRNGNATGDSGGGIRANSILTLTNTAILSNTTDSYGGGLRIDGGLLSISQSRLAYNTGWSGGGIYAGSGVSKVTLADSSVFANTSTRGAGAYIESDTEIIDSEIEENQVTEDGGGLYVQGSLAVTGTQVLSNTARMGAGATVRTGDIRIMDSAFINNRAQDGSGGALHSDGSGWIEILDSRFLGNRANNGDGGAVFRADNILQPVRVVNSLFENNLVTSDSEPGRGSGGALWFWNSTLTVENSTFVSNTAGYWGGALLARGGVQITGGRFERNSGEDGGAMFSFSEAVISGTRFLSNTAQLDGGAIYIYDSDLAISNAQIIGNHAGDGTVDEAGNPIGSGGGVILEGDYPTVTISDTVFLQNSASNAGGGLSANHPVLLNVQFTQNYAEVAGGGVYVPPKSYQYAPDGTLSLIDSSFMGNKAGNGGAIGGVVGVADINTSQFVKNQALAGSGGALIVNGYGAGLNLSHSTFENNSATESGGAFVANKANIQYTDFLGNSAATDGGAIQLLDKATITTSLFLSNTATHNGGAINAVYGYFSEVSFIGNRAEMGGAVYYVGERFFFNWPLDLQNVLLARNQATGSGAAALHMLIGDVSLNHITIADTVPNPHPAIYYATQCGNSSGCGRVKMHNSILYNHPVGISVGESTGPTAGGIVLNMDYVLLSDVAKPISSTEPVLLGDHNFRGIPDFVSPDADNYDLGAASQARDAADPQDCPPVDIRDTARPQGIGCDMGAYEGASLSPAIALTPNTFSFITLPGVGQITPQSLHIDNAGVGVLNWNASGSAAWLSASPSAGTQTADIEVHVNRTGLTPGIHQANLTVNGNAVPPQSIASLQVEVLNPATHLLKNGDFEDRYQVEWSDWDRVISQADNMSGLGIPRSGQYAVVLGSQNGDRHELSQRIKIPSGDTLTLTYFYQIISEEETCTYDTVNVLLDDLLLSEHGLCPENNTSGWQQHTIDLTPYGNREGIIRFIQDNDHFGSPSVFLLDDVSITAQAPVLANSIYLPAVIR